jgi:hypothetical protein
MAANGSPPVVPTGFGENQLARNEEPPVTVCGRLAAAGGKAVRSHYFWACVVYFIYNCGALAINECAVGHGEGKDVAVQQDPYYYYDPAIPGPSMITPDPYAVTEPVPLCRFGATGIGYTLGWGPLNVQYTVWASIHLFNSLQYWWAWREFGVDLTSPLAFADVCNVVMSAVYVFTSTIYPKMGNDPVVYVPQLELAASILYFIASFGWAWAWWVTHIRGPGRGMTMDDPDVSGIIFLFAPSITYIVYNAHILAVPADWGSFYLYKTGDFLYFAGGVAYLLVALRDAGFLWWMPCLCLNAATELGLVRPPSPLSAGASEASEAALPLLPTWTSLAQFWLSVLSCGRYTPPVRALRSTAAAEKREVHDGVDARENPEAHVKGVLGRTKRGGEPTVAPSEVP